MAGLAHVTPPSESDGLQIAAALSDQQLEAIFALTPGAPSGSAIARVRSYRQRLGPGVRLGRFIPDDPGMTDREAWEKQSALALMMVFSGQRAIPRAAIAQMLVTTALLKPERAAQVADHIWRKVEVPEVITFVDAAASAREDLLVGNTRSAMAHLRSAMVVARDVVRLTMLDPIFRSFGDWVEGAVPLSAAAWLHYYARHGRPMYNGKPAVFVGAPQRADDAASVTSALALLSIIARSQGITVVVNQGDIPVGMPTVINLAEVLGVPWAMKGLAALSPGADLAWANAIGASGSEVTDVTSRTVMIADLLATYPRMVATPQAPEAMWEMVRAIRNLRDRSAFLDRFDLPEKGIIESGGPAVEEGFFPLLAQLAPMALSLLGGLGGGGGGDGGGGGGSPLSGLLGGLLGGGSTGSPATFGNQQPSSPLSGLMGTASQLISAPMNIVERVFGMFGKRKRKGGPPAELLDTPTNEEEYGGWADATDAFFEEGGDEDDGDDSEAGGLRDPFELGGRRKKKKKKKKKKKQRARAQAALEAAAEMEDEAADATVAQDESEQLADDNALLRQRLKAMRRQLAASERRHVDVYDEEDDDFDDEPQYRSSYPTGHGDISSEDLLGR